MNLKFFFFFACLSMVLIVNAQKTRNTIVDELTRQDLSGGVITINSNSSINDLLGTPVSEIHTLNETYVKIPGYRLQVFSGNERQSKDEAYSRAREIKELFPEISTSVTYKAPVWRLRVGDFQTSEEADIFLRDLKKKIPSLGREANVVTEEIKVVL